MIDKFMMDGACKVIFTFMIQFIKDKPDRTISTLSEFYNETGIFFKDNILVFNHFYFCFNNKQQQKEKLNRFCILYREKI